MQDLRKTKKELIAELAALRQRVKELEESGIVLRDEERYTQAANALLRLFASATSREEYLGVAVKLINIWSDCRYVGIRVLNNNGEIPYEAYLGFSREFWESENWLSVHEDQCACIRVITGKPDSQDLGVMTRGGSFYLDNSMQFLHGLSEAQRARFRGVCIKCGFKSIAIVPIAQQGRIFGVIHIADEEGGKVSLKLVEFLELVAFSMGQALKKFSADGDDRAGDAHFRFLMESSQDSISLISLDGRYLGMNTAGYRLNRFDDPAAVLGKSLTANIVENRAGVEEAIRRTAAGKEMSVQYRCVDQSGRKIWWNSMLTPVRRTDGSIRSILSISRDITARQGQ